MTGYSWRHGVTALLGLYASNSSITAHGKGVSPVQGKLGDLVFSPCPANSSSIPGAECGYAIVPLDYTNPDAGVAKIALGRYNATSSTRKGSVLFNPGGPGGSGVGLATQAGAQLQQIVGEEYDIIGFDPRGIGQTEPATQCFPTPEARDAFIANTVLDRGYDVSPNVTDPFNRYHLIQLQHDAEALYKTQFAICGQNMGDQLRYMGTTSVVRDIDYITTLLDGKDALINFYGLSYGTVIGQYLVNMFPDRVGRVVIDGVVDANAWTFRPPYKWYRTWLDATDSVYKLFFDDCVKAGPSACALAKANETGEDIFNRVEAFVANLYDHPMPAPNATNPGMLTNGRARLFLLSILEVPETWPTMANYLAAALAGDPTLIMNAVSPGQFPDLERSGVSCNDQMPFTAPTPEETIDEAIDVYKTVTLFNFAVTVAEADSGCQYWPVTPPERYAGPWNATTKNPVLIVSNTHDPVTPLTNGKLVQSMLKSSALLVQDGPGHTSLALPSTCTVLNTRAFFANGTLPAAGTVCPIDGTPFPDPAAANGTKVAAAAKENVETLGAAQTHGDYAQAVRHVASFVLGGRH